MSNPDEILALAERFVAALTAHDADTVRAIYAPDARIWHNSTGTLQTVDENIQSLHRVHSVLDNLHYDVQRREAINGGFFQQHILRGTLASGEAFAMPACAICDVNDGRITRLDEYLNAADAAPLHPSS